jgi:serine/threonine protein kinase/Tfp pilus assembly protein PilF
MDMFDSERALLEQALGGRYVVEGEVGRGGMATVYKAYDVRHGRAVAVKVLRPDLSAILGVERFRREIAIASQLSHPHIVPLIDSGELQESGSAQRLLYYVSQFVPGGSLRDRLRAEGRLELREALRVATEIGDALDFAHRGGVVHRDVKPENILFADGHALLADFGLARACNQTADTSLTEVGLALGTPAYMSPEQALGQSDIAAAADIYSLACVLYEMLVGALPFEGSSAALILAAQLKGQPRSPRVVRPEIPAHVDQAILRALAPEPQGRFRSVQEFLDALTISNPVPKRGVAARSLAVLPFVNATHDAANDYLSDGLTDELIDALSRIRELRVAARTSVFSFKGRELDVRSVGALLGVSLVTEGSVRREGDRIRVSVRLLAAESGEVLWSERFERRLDDIFRLQDEIVATVVAALRHGWIPELAEPLPQRYAGSSKAYALYLQGRHAWNTLRSNQGFHSAVSFFRAAIAEDSRFAPAYAGLADCYALHADYARVPVSEGFALARSYAEQALAIDDSLAEAHASLGWIRFIYDWDWIGARSAFRRALEYAPYYVPAHQWHAFLLMASGEVREALLEGHEAADLDPASAVVRRSLGWLNYYAERHEMAARHLERAIDLDPVQEESYRVLGLVLVAQERFADALRVLGEAVALPEASDYTRAVLGAALAGAGQTAETEALLRALEERALATYVSPVCFAILNVALGRRAAAFDWIERAIAERRGWVVYLDVEPLLRDLRGDSRFAALRAAVGLPARPA